MGHALRRFRHDSPHLPRFNPRRSGLTEKFPDLNELPPELAILILSNLNATDLCLAMCVNDFWRQLAMDDLLWQGLCYATWGSVSAYHKKKDANFSYRELYQRLDDHSLLFNWNAELGIEYLLRDGILNNDPKAIAYFINSTNRLDRSQVRRFVTGRQEVLDELIKLDNYTDKMLPIALRSFFANVESPFLHGNRLQVLLEKFAERYLACNPQCRLTKDGICVPGRICYYSVFCCCCYHITELSPTDL
ncbi:F-box only protein 8-like isoform X2 [Apostichopus japonicus]|uniref:F-box only protein 8-like isoform X2 n=1 Tax=Stichopus japonicus TaxID=307972 RepID=UPI003AB2C6E8